MERLLKICQPKCPVCQLEENTTKDTQNNSQRKMLLQFHYMKED